MSEQCDRCHDYVPLSELRVENGRRLCESCRLETRTDEDTEHDDDMGDDGRWDGDCDD
jgi:hypothetical protein